MLARSVHDRSELADLLRRDAALHAYELGDLDDALWPYTSWYRLGDAVALVYHGLGTPILLALGRERERAAVTALIGALVPLLPARFTAQVCAAAERALTDRVELRAGGPPLKMTLTDPGRPHGVPALGEPLGPADAAELVALYDRAYPTHTFHPDMLAHGPYLGVRRDGVLVAAAGTHIWSRRYRVAALGNVVTRPDVRGQGLATALVAAWCRQVAGTAEHVALNVHEDNTTAVRVYQRVGFTTAGRFAEFTATARPATVGRAVASATGGRS